MAHKRMATKSTQRFTLQSSSILQNVQYRLTGECVHGMIGLNRVIIESVYRCETVLFKAVHRITGLLIAGGWDVEALPELEYRQLRARRRAVRTSYGLEKADFFFFFKQKTAYEM